MVKTDNNKNKYEIKKIEKVTVENTSQFKADSLKTLVKQSSLEDLFQRKRERECTNKRYQEF